MKSLKQIEYLGWGFFGLAFAVLVGPAIYVAWNYTYEATNNMTRVGIGLVSAIILAGLITWPINEVLVRTHRRKVENQRKQQRKEKKRRGKN